MSISKRHARRFRSSAITTMARRNTDAYNGFTTWVRRASTGWISHRHGFLSCQLWVFQEWNWCWPSKRLPLQPSWTAAGMVYRSVQFAGSKDQRLERMFHDVSVLGTREPHRFEKKTLMVFMSWWRTGQTARHDLIVNSYQAKVEGLRCQKRAQLWTCFASDFKVWHLLWRPWSCCSLPAMRGITWPSSRWNLHGQLVNLLEPAPGKWDRCLFVWPEFDGLGAEHVQEVWSQGSATFDANIIDLDEFDAIWPPIAVLVVDVHITWMWVWSNIRVIWADKDAGSPNMLGHTSASCFCWTQAFGDTVHCKAPLRMFGAIFLTQGVVFSVELWKWSPAPASVTQYGMLNCQVQDLDQDRRCQDHWGQTFYCLDPSCVGASKLGNCKDDATFTPNDGFVYDSQFFLPSFWGQHDWHLAPICHRWKWPQVPAPEDQDSSSCHRGDPQQGRQSREISSCKNSVLADLPGTSGRGSIHCNRGSDCAHYEDEKNARAPRTDGCATASRSKWGRKHDHDHDQTLTMQECVWFRPLLRLNHQQLVTEAGRSFHMSSECLQS